MVTYTSLRRCHQARAQLLWLETLGTCHTESWRPQIGILGSRKSIRCSNHFRILHSCGSDMPVIIHNNAWLLLCPILWCRTYQFLIKIFKFLVRTVLLVNFLVTAQGCLGLPSYIQVLITASFCRAIIFATSCRYVNIFGRLLFILLLVAFMTIVEGLRHNEVGGCRFHHIPAMRGRRDLVVRVFLVINFVWGVVTVIGSSLQWINLQLMFVCVDLRILFLLQAVF